MSGGIIRPARRPAGFIATGPPRDLPADRPEIWPREGEDLCYLTGDWRILQRIGGHRWSLDDLATAWFAGVTADVPPRTALDLGCGIGSVLLMSAWRFPDASLTGIEAQPLSVDLARRSIAHNGVEGRCRVVHADLRHVDLRGDHPDGFELITGTPPYWPPGTATRGAAPQLGPTRHEDRGGVEEYCLTAARHLADGGRFVVCHAAPQARRVRAAATAAGLHLTRVIDIIPREGKPPLITVFAFARRPPGDRVQPDPTITVRDTRDQWTPAFRALRRGMGMPDAPPDNG